MTKRLLLLLAVVALLAAACGGSGDDGVATLEDSTTTTVTADPPNAIVGDEERLMEFAACMRDNGVPDFPDPSVSGDGAVDFGGFAQFEDFDEDVLNDAFNACSDNLVGLSFAPGGADFDFTEIQDTLVEFAACMRDNGFDLPDPDFSNFDLGGGAGSGPFGDIDPTDPAFETAFEACQGIFANLPFGG